MSGKVIRRSTYHREAPRVDAAPSSRSSKPRRPASSASTASGNETNVAASTAAAVVKVSWMPNHSYSHDPTIPVRLPNAASKPTPATTGGMTSGRTTSTRTSVFPRNELRTSTHARGNPRMNEISAAVVATSSESRSAVSAVSVVRISTTRDQGVRVTRPTNGSATSATPRAARTAKPAGVRPLRGGEETVVGEGLLPSPRT